MTTQQGFINGYVRSRAIEQAWYGWKPDKPDARDHVWTPPKRRLARANASRNLIQPFSWRGHIACPPIANQDRLGSCTAFSSGRLFRFWQRLQQLPDFDPSYLWLYYNTRELEGTVPYDDGGEIRDAFKILANLGLAPGMDWPYDEARFADRPPAQSYADALHHQVVRYQRVPVDVKHVKLALRQGPIVVGFTVGASFESDQVAKTGIWEPIDGERTVGGHAIEVEGWEKLKGHHGREYAVCPNSWDDDWGDVGYVHIPLAWLCNTNHADDFWTLTEVER